MTRRRLVTPAELAAMRRFFRPVKQPVSIRLDADVLHWFKVRGRGWQTAINRAWRAHIERNVSGHLPLAVRSGGP